MKYNWIQYLISYILNIIFGINISAATIDRKRANKKLIRSEYPYFTLFCILSTLKSAYSNLFKQIKHIMYAYYLTN